MKDDVSYAHWGGFVYSESIQMIDLPAMGSGHFPEEGVVGKLPTLSLCKYGTVQILFIQTKSLSSCLQIYHSATMHLLFITLLLPSNLIFTMEAPFDVSLKYKIQKTLIDQSHQILTLN